MHNNNNNHTRQKKNNIHLYTDKIKEIKNNTNKWHYQPNSTGCKDVITTITRIGHTYLTHV